MTASFSVRLAVDDLAYQVAMEYGVDETRQAQLAEAVAETVRLALKAWIENADTRSKT